VPSTAAYRLALRRLADAFGCGPGEEEVLASRSRLSLFEVLQRSRTGLRLVDTGYGGPETAEVPVPSREILRLETAAEELVPSHADVGSWLDAVGATVRRSRAVAVKTIVAYRASLRLRPPPPADLPSAYERLRRQARPRLAGNTLCHALLLRAAAECARLERPLQVHCGLGDPDEDLAESSPLGLRPLLTEPGFDGLRVVLLHCYPFHREAAYLCSVYPNVWMDLSLAVPLAALDARRAMAETLGLCPWSKLLYASDASRLPEMYLVASLQYREALARGFGELVAAGALDLAEAESAGRLVLAGNARGLYGLE
jgi:uncharacterized protein